MVLKNYLRAYIQNKIPGTQQYTLLLKYGNVREATKDFNKLDLTYRLNDAVLMLADMNTYLLCPKALKKKRLQKIIRASTAMNKTELDKFGRNIMPLSGLQSINGYDDDPAELHITLKSSHNSKVSNEHYTLLQKIGANLKKPAGRVGLTKSLLHVATIKKW